MSNETGGATTERSRAIPAATLALVSGAAPRLVAGSVALLAAGLVTALRVARNAPVALPGFVSDASPFVVLAGALVPALAAVGVAVVAESLRERIGLAFVGVFGTLAAFELAPALSSAVAVVLGAAIAASARFSRPARYAELRPWIAAGVVLLGVLVSLAAGLGIAPGLRSGGTLLALVGLAATPVLARPDYPAWVCGGLAGATVIVAASTAPFVTGAVVLVAAGVVGTPALFLAAGVAGATTTVVASLRRGSPVVAVGVALLAVGGVPATVPRAVVVTFGLSLALTAVDAAAPAASPGDGVPDQRGGDPA